MTLDTRALAVTFNNAVVRDTGLTFEQMEQIITAWEDANVDWRGYVQDALRMLREAYCDYGQAVDLLETVLTAVESKP
jgi:hypothetical protein